MRLATVAPEGTAWARELKAFRHDVAAATGDQVRIKLYFGGSAGDEPSWKEHFTRGHLDGAIGGLLCEHIAPSMKVLRLPGLFQSREEANFVMNRLQTRIQAEARQSGFALLGTAALGADVVFSRTPVRSLADLRRGRYWRWAEDVVGTAGSRAMGMSIVELPLSEENRAYDEGRVDGFLGILSGALAFQWSTRARYVTDIRFGYVFGCAIFRNATFDALPPEHRDALTTSVAKLRVRMNDLGRVQDAQLLGGLLERQGVKTLPPSPTFRAEFFRAAAAARAQIADRFVSRALLEEVTAALADYRAERHVPHD